MRQLALKEIILYKVLFSVLVCAAVLCTEGAARKKAIGCGWGFNNVTVDDFLANAESFDATGLDGVLVWLRGKDAAGKPVWQLNQGFDYDGSVTDPAKFVPDLPSLRYAHWAAFRYGIQGLGFYQCGTAKASKFPGIFAAAVDFYRQAAALTFVLTQDDITGYLDLPAPLKSRVIRRDGRVYAIVQNASYEPCKVKIGIRGKCAEKIRVLYENRVLRQKNGVFHDVFRPLDSRIYEFTEGK